MENKFLNSRGFMMLNVVFLTLIVSFIAIIFLNGAATVSNPTSALRTTALSLMNEQFAEVESRAAQGNLSAGTLSFLGVSDDLKSYNANKNIPVNFNVLTTVQNLSENFFRVKVKVKWNFHGRNFEIESEKLVGRLSD